MPSGTAVIIAMAVVRKVPDNNGRIPYLFSVNNGVHSVSKRNSPNGTAAKNPHDSETRTQIIPAVVNTVSSPLKARTFSMIFSLVFFKILIALPAQPQILYLCSGALFPEIKLLYVDNSAWYSASVRGIYPTSGTKAAASSR